MATAGGKGIDPDVGGRTTRAGIRPDNPVSYGAPEHPARGRK